MQMILCHKMKYLSVSMYVRLCYKSSLLKVRSKMPCPYVFVYLSSDFRVIM